MRTQFMVRPVVFSALVLSFFSVLVLNSTPASAQSSAPTSCTTMVIPVNSQNQGNVTPGGVNVHDTVVGSFQDLTTFVVHGFTWPGTGTGQLYDYPGASQTQLGAINDAGTAVGTYFDSQSKATGLLLAKSGQTITFSVPGAYNTFANGINKNNVIVGFSEPFAGGPDAGFKKQGKTYTTIQFPGAVGTYPVAINDIGAIVGWYYDGSTEHGFMEFQNSYSTLEPAGASSSMAKGINNSGEIVGEYRPNANAQGEGFTYTNGKYTAHMYPSSTYTELSGVNSLGDRVGDAITSNQPFLTGPGFLLKCR